MADPEEVQGASEQIISFLKGYSRKMRDHLQIDPSLIYLNPSPGVVDPPLNKKAYVDISGFTGKPVKGEGFNDLEGSSRR